MPQPLRYPLIWKGRREERGKPFSFSGKCNTGDRQKAPSIYRERMKRIFPLEGRSRFISVTSSLAAAYSRREVEVDVDVEGT